MTWLNVVSIVCGILGISAGCGELVKIFLKKKIAQHEDTRHTQLVHKIQEVVNKAVEPINQQLTHIEQELALNKSATIASLRANMKQLRDHYKAQGYADAGDTGTWNELYDDYKAMGGNHFKAYVDQWKQEVNELPLEKLEDK